MLRTALIVAFCLSSTQLTAEQLSEKDKKIERFFGEYLPYKEFFFSLKKAFSTNDKQAVMGLISFPLTVNFTSGAEKKTVIYKNSEMLMPDFDIVFPETTKFKVATQTYESLFFRDAGFMVDDGEIWFSGFCKLKSGPCELDGVGIYSVNTETQ